MLAGRFVNTIIVVGVTWPCAGGGSMNRSDASKGINEMNFFIVCLSFSVS
jgi:hypothetical protein